MAMSIGTHPDKPAAMVVSSSIALLFLVLVLGLVGPIITRQRAMPNQAGALERRI
jgi:hypothetical protein